MRKFYLFLLLLACFNTGKNLRAADSPFETLLHEYNLLYYDLLNYNTYGYKSSWDAVRDSGSDLINKSQGSLLQTGNPNDFAILGDGFFKIRLEDDRIGYTRAGDFKLARNGESGGMDLVTSDGYGFFDPVSLPRGMMRLAYENGAIYALSYDGQKTEAGRLRVFAVDEGLLLRYNEDVFVTAENVNSEGETGARILNGFLETGNVSVPETLMRMHIILALMKDIGHDYGSKDQILMMLINNLPVIDELMSIKSALQELTEALSKDRDKDASGASASGGYGTTRYKLLENSLPFLGIQN
jgi:flagellar basal body rod protein FlgF